MSYITTKQHMLNVADYRSLHAYVAALPDAERIAYYYANPDYMLGQYPAYLMHEADVLTKAGDLAGAAELVGKWTHARFLADIAARRAAAAPKSADRVAGAIVGAWGPSLFGVCVTLAAYVAGAPHLAAGLATLAGCFAALGAVGGLISGGR